MMTFSPSRVACAVEMHISMTMRAILVGAAIVCVNACSPSRLTDASPPSNILPPGAIATQIGAVGLYNGALSAFSVAYAGQGLLQSSPYVAVNGVFSDEYSTPLNSVQAYYDLRIDNQTQNIPIGAYDGLQKARVNMDEALHALQPYASTTPSSYVAELYSLKGYVYVLLSELFCSGVPFSYLVNQGDIVFGTPESTTEMLQNAVTLFDSALAVSTDSTRIQYLAQVGKGRALVDLADFADAKASVASVPTNFTYQFTYSTGTFPNYLSQETQTGFQFVTTLMSDPSHWYQGREGGNGLNYSTSNDPRVATAQAGFCSFPGSTSCYLIPAKFPTASAPVMLASGIEARLIEAEADLQSNDIADWASTLNTLRQSAGSTPISILTSDSTTSAPDTLRVNVMFRERAFWMFGTGHRTGDMRRLIRQYHRTESTVFPIGVQPYLSTPPNIYGSEVNLEPPAGEAENNPKYHGCLNRDA